MNTKAEVIEYLKRRLGYPTVQVELTDGQFDDSVEDALRLFNRYFVLPKLEAYQDRTGSVVIDWPDSATGVLYSTFVRPESYRSAIRFTVFDILYRMMPQQLPVGTWYMYRSFYEMYQKARGIQPTWQADPVNRKLYVDCFSGPYGVYVIWALDVTVLSLLTGNLRRWKNDFMRACLAYTKERLVPVRGKFGGIPAPGGTLTTDAERLAAESRTDLEAVEAKLRKRLRGFYRPVIG